MSDSPASLKPQYEVEFSPYSLDEPLYRYFSDPQVLSGQRRRARALFERHLFLYSDVVEQVSAKTLQKAISLALITRAAKNKDVITSGQGIEQIYRNCLNYISQEIISEPEEPSPRKNRLETSTHTYVSSGRSDKDTIFVSTLLKRGSLFSAVCALFSLMTLALFEVPMIHPLLAMILVVASPFFYAMGRIAEKNAQHE